MFHTGDILASRGDPSEDDERVPALNLSRALITSRWLRDARRRGATIVSMNQPPAGITAEPGEAKEAGTYALCGCTAVAANINNSSGIRRAHVQHYGAGWELDSILSLKRFVDMTAQTADSGQIVIMAPGRLIEGEGKPTIELDNPTFINLLASATGPLEGRANVQVVPYVADETDTSYAKGTLSIELLASGESRILAEGNLVEPSLK